MIYYNNKQYDMASKVEKPCKLINLNVTENGEYLPTDGDGFKKVTVNVPQGGGDVNFAAMGYQIEPGREAEYKQGYEANIEQLKALGDFGTSLNNKQLGNIIPLALDTSNVTDFTSACSRTVEYFPKWDLRKGVIFKAFALQHRIKDKVIYADTPNGENFVSFLDNIDGLPNSIEEIYIDLSKAKNIDSTFRQLDSLKKITLLGNQVISPTSCDGTFMKCTNLVEAPVIDLTNITNFARTFALCSNLSTLRFRGILPESTPIDYLFTGLPTNGYIYLDSVGYSHNERLLGALPEGWRKILAN